MPSSFRRMCLRSFFRHVILVMPSWATDGSERGVRRVSHGVTSSERHGVVAPYGPAHVLRSCRSLATTTPRHGPDARPWPKAGSPNAQRS